MVLKHMVSQSIKSMSINDSSQTALSTNSPLPVIEETIATTVKRDATGNLGFTVAGGRSSNSTDADQRLYICRVAYNGPAYKDGRLRVGDRILSVKILLYYIFYTYMS